jgi:predicted dehydrogenase
MVKRIHNGALGEIVCGEAYFYFPMIELPPWPKVSVAERRIRNWIYDRVLSGDILIEQNIHAVDICNWVLQGYPVKAVGGGGRKTPRHPGEDTWDHFNITYTYPNNVHVSFSSTKFDLGWWDVCERFFGTKGVSESHYLGGVRIYGEEPWDSGFGGPGHFWQGLDMNPLADALKDSDSEKQKTFISSITSAEFHNQAAQGAESTLSAILGRSAAYTGREVTWDELIRSEERWESGIDLYSLA